MSSMLFDAKSKRENLQEKKQTNNSSKLWSSQLWTQFKQLRKEPWKSQDFNGVWTRKLTTPVRRSNQLSCSN